MVAGIAKCSNTRSGRSIYVRLTWHIQRLGGSPHNQTQLELTRRTVARANQLQNACAVPAYHLFTLGKRWWTFNFPEKRFGSLLLCGQIHSVTVLHATGDGTFSVVFDTRRRHSSNAEWISVKLRLPYAAWQGLALGRMRLRGGCPWTFS